MDFYSTVIVQLHGGFWEKGGDVLVTCTRIFIFLDFPIGTPKTDSALM